MRKRMKYGLSYGAKPNGRRSGRRSRKVGFEMRVPFLLLVIAIFSFSAQTIWAMRAGAGRVVEEFGNQSVVVLEGRLGRCIGTFIANIAGADDVLMTDAQCLRNFSSGGVHIVKGMRSGRKNAESKAVFVNPNIRKPDYPNEDQQYGVALVFFEDETASSVTRLSSNPGGRGGGVLLVSYEPKGFQGKRRGVNRILDLNGDKEGKGYSGYLLHEGYGVMPELRDDWGSPLFIEGAGLIGVLHGCGDDILIQSHKLRGYSCGYISVLSSSTLKTIELAQGLYPHALAGIDVNRLARLGSRPSVGMQQATTQQRPPASAYSQTPQTPPATSLRGTRVQLRLPGNTLGQTPPPKKPVPPVIQGQPPSTQGLPPQGQAAQPLIAQQPSRTPPAPPSQPGSVRIRIPTPLGQPSAPQSPQTQVTPLPPQTPVTSPNQQPHPPATQLQPQVPVVTFPSNRELPQSPRTDLVRRGSDPVYGPALPGQTGNQTPLQGLGPQVPVPGVVQPPKPLPKAKPVLSAAMRRLLEADRTPRTDTKGARLGQTPVGDSGDKEKDKDEAKAKAKKPPPIDLRDIVPDDLK